MLFVAALAIGCAGHQAANADAQGLKCLEAPRTRATTKCALEAFADAVKLDGENADYRNHLGVALMRARLFSQAADVFKEALRIDPAHVKARKNLASVTEWLESDRAERVADEIAARQPY